MMGTMIAVALLLAAVTVVAIRRLGRLAGPANPWPPLFGNVQAPPPLPPDAPLPPAPSGPDVSLDAQIGRVVSAGMDRVDAMRQFGADRFLTFMPMPDGTCWALSVIRFPDEAAAKASYRSASPMVTH